MEEIIYLTCTRQGVVKMTKNLPYMQRGEIPVKLKVKIEPSAFKEPVIEREVHIIDWREGVDIADIEFKEATITEEEAALIRERRLDKMREILEANGYEIKRTEPTEP